MEGGIVARLEKRGSPERATVALSSQILTVQAKEQVTGGELTGAGSSAMGQPGSRGELEWQLRTADVLKKGGRLSDTEAGSQFRGAHLVGY